MLILEQIRVLIFDISGKNKSSEGSFDGIVDKFLFLIHIKRKKLTEPYKKRANIILLKLFEITNDIRFFNEALWLCNNKKDAEHRLILYKGLIRKLPQKKYNKLDFQVYEFKKNHLAKLKSKRIAFIGIPYYFVKVVKYLKKNKINSTVIFINYHPNKILRWFLHLNLLNKLICSLLFPGTNIHYYKVSSHIQLKDIVLNNSFDIGFHKIPGIIPENISGKFSDGLINDHWGLLPDLKGRSTILYSILLNAPVIISNHFIEKSIDAGNIVNYTKLDIFKNWSFANKVNLHLTFPHRVINSLCSYYHNNGPIAINSSRLGKVYYEIHPVLKRFIITNSLSVYSH
jgi:hypothetical protein